MIQYLLSLLIPIGYLIIPSISLYKPVQYMPITNHTYDTSELGYSVAFLDGTIWDDTSWGRTVLIGHTPGGFEGLTELINNDRIILLTNSNEYEYRVTAMHVVYDAYDTSWLNPTQTHILTLITCHDDGWLIVEATLYYE